MSDASGAEIQRIVSPVTRSAQPEAPAPRRTGGSPASLKKAGILATSRERRRAEEARLNKALSIGKETYNLRHSDLKEKQEEAGKAIKMAIKHLTKTAASDPGTAESGPGAKGKPGSGGDEDLAHYVADFLFDNSHRTDCFGPDHIAEYLATGEGGFHARVRFWYAQRLDLSHLKFIQAFRVFLVDSGFNITGLEGSSASTRVPPVPPKLKPALVIVLTPNLRPAPAHTPMQSPQYRCEDCPYDGVLQRYILPRQSSFPYPIGRRGGNACVHGNGCPYRVLERKSAQAQPTTYRSRVRQLLAREQHEAI